VWRKAFLALIVVEIILGLVAYAATSSDTHIFWYLSRTSALLAYILLFINIVFGLGLKTKFMDKVSARWQSYDLHQFTALLAMGLITFHIFILMGDQYMSASLKDLLVPMSGAYRPFWTALGIISFYVLLLITMSSLLRRFIGQKVWRAIHMLSFVLFYVILYHGIKAGTDSANLWVQIMYIFTGAAATGLFLWRFLLATKTTPHEQTSRRQIPGDAIK
jgi:predicted ferric reductase